MPAASLGADHPLTEEEDGNSEDGSRDEDTVALLKEPNEIKKDRAEERARKETEQKAEEERHSHGRYSDRKLP